MIVIKRHIDYMFEFQQWKIAEQVSYVTNSDLTIFEPYNPIINSKHVLTKGTIQQGDILVLLKPQWYDASNVRGARHPTVKPGDTNNGKNIKVNRDNQIIRLPSDIHSPTSGLTTPREAATKSPNKVSNPSLKQSNSNKTDESTKSKSKLMSMLSPRKISNRHKKHSDEDFATIEIKMKDFKEYITIQALCAASNICSNEITKYLEENPHCRTFSDAIVPPQLNQNNSKTSRNDEIKYNDDLDIENKNNDNDSDNDTPVQKVTLFHDGKSKNDSFYFCICSGM